MLIVAWRAKANENHLPATFNVPGERTFNTNDLIEEHPTRKGYYRVLGRYASVRVGNDALIITINILPGSRTS